MCSFQQLDFTGWSFHHFVSLKLKSKALDTERSVSVLRLLRKYWLHCSVRRGDTEFSRGVSWQDFARLTWREWSSWCGQLDKRLFASTSLSETSQDGSNQFNSLLFHERAVLSSFPHHLSITYFVLALTFKLRVCDAFSLNGRKLSS